jgi:hypothetical protein
VTSLASVRAPGNDEWLSVNIRFDLAPGPTLGCATGAQELLHVHLVFFGDLQVVIDSEGATLHDGAKNVGTRCTVGQS